MLFTPTGTPTRILLGFGRIPDGTTLHGGGLGLLAAFLASTFFGLLWIEPLADAVNHPQVLIGAWIWVGSLWLFAALAWRDVSRIRSHGFETL